MDYFYNHNEYDFREKNLLLKYSLLKLISGTLIGLNLIIFSECSFNYNENPHTIRRPCQYSQIYCLKKKEEYI
ncbi:MAG: hypothetical protein ACOYT4_03935 [Nanoarchaeota archaeon]